MPRVPTYQGDQVRTGPVRLPRQRAVPTPATYGAQFGETLGHAADIVSQIVVEQRQRADDLVVTTAEREFNQLYQIGLLSEDRGPQGSKGLATMVGIEPQNQLQANLAEWDQQSEEILKAATNPQQRVRLEHMRNQQRARYVESATRHASTEYAKYETGQTKGLLNSSLQTAIVAAGTEGGDEVVYEQLRRQEEIIEQRGHTIGLLSPEAKADYRAQLRSATHVGVIENLLSKQQDVAAEAYFQTAEQAGEINAEHLPALREKLEVNSRDARAYQEANNIFDTMAKGAIANDTLAIPNDAMAAEARRRAGDDPKLYKQMRAYLDDRVGQLQAQRRETADQSKSTIWGSIAKGATVDQVRALPAFRQAPGEEQNRVLEYFRREAEHREALAAAAESRAAAREGRAAAAETRAWTRAQRAEQERENEGWGRYFELSEPTRLRTLSRGEIFAELPTLGRDHVTRLLNDQEQLGRSDTAVRAATIDRELFQDIAYSAGLEYAYTNPASLRPDQKARLGRLQTQVESEIARQQTATNRVLTLDQKRTVMQDIITQRVWIDRTALPDQSVIAATVQQNEMGNAYVLFEDIPGKSLTMMLNYLRGLPPRAGTLRVRAPTDPELIAAHKDRLQRAYARAVLGGSDAEWQAILEGKDPDATRPGPGTGAAPIVQD